MARFQAFDREIKFVTEGISQEAITRELAQFARRELKKAISEGASPVYDLYVNGRPASSEFEVDAPGPIVYEFALWEPVITLALSELQKRAPHKSGRFRNSFIVIVDGVVVSPMADIPARSEVIITNFQPYVRKAEGGVLGVPRRQIFDGTKRVLASRFGNEGRNTPAAFRFETRWLNIASGVHPDIPYILKGRQRVIAAKASHKSSAFRAGRASLSRRKDLEAGQAITYPAIVMNMVF